ncbi:hypothetical protein B0A52_02928 [Exophiala mesophila]|uniref:FAD-dependent oxidoreductase 2 FAD-binding domain-containing protein n=1 Tax=Exophiala mesophila TaxID=212818 RepID=A0A438NBZ3_EXOME|nr:hypothetical protein B0A52_02928 [Exophiala mesophila]
MANFEESFDVIVVGGGNAGFSAATTAAQAGAQVILVETAPESEQGGNTYFTAGAYRYAFDGLDDLLPILYTDEGTKGLPQDLIDKIDITPYRKDDFQADIKRVCQHRSDPELARVLVDGSRGAIQWIADNGGKWHLSFHRQAYEVDGRYKFWGGMVTAFLGGGKALVEWHVRLAVQSGVKIAWGTTASSLVLNDDNTRVLGVQVTHNGTTRTLRARGGVILACGGFQASPDLRAQHLGREWAYAHVRGCKYNTGDGLRLAAQVDAQPTGDYPGCHSVCWDANSPFHGGDRFLTNQYTKSGYPFGLMLNIDGCRFVDEGLDLRNYTYAIFGKEVLKQPESRAFQIWDNQGFKWLRKEEYAPDVTTILEADTLQELAVKLGDRGLRHQQQFLDTIEEYNRAARAFRQENPHIEWDPSKKDGLSTQSSQTKLSLAKSNWAVPLETGPFRAVEIVCGITFTFGGLQVDPHTASVVSQSTGKPIPGLYSVGELLGGLFYSNYPGGSGLTAGTVFGRIAGAHAAAAAQQNVSGT